MQPTDPVGDDGPEPQDGQDPAVPAKRHGWRQALPLVMGAAIFAVALFVLYRTLSRYSLGQVEGELANLSPGQVGQAVLYSALSFLALVGYEVCAMRLIGRKVPLRNLMLASFVTQSIAHSTGFGFVVGATLRYQFYARRGITVLDVAKIQVLYTATFTLGVSTLAGIVLLVDPYRLAAATGLPVLAWRAGAGTALALVCAYVVWGAFFHRPLTVGGRSLVLPRAGSTLFQIACGVLDLLAVAGALYVLLPAELHLGYLDVLSVFIASVVVGWMSHVPGSIGVFEGAMILLLQPGEGAMLPLVGALLAFRACYYLLPLACGVAVLALHEGARWRQALGRAPGGAAGRLWPWSLRLAAPLTALAGALLLLATATPVPPARAVQLARLLPRAAVAVENPLCGALGIGLLVLARGVALKVARAWVWGVLMLGVGAAVCLATAESPVIWLPLLATLALLAATRHAFVHPPPRLSAWMTPAWFAVCTAGVALAAFFLARG